MSTFDAANIPSQVIDEVTIPLVTSEPSLFEGIGTVYDRATTLSGTIPGLSQETVLSGPRATPYQPGESVQEHEGGMSNTTFSCGRFHDAYTLTAEEAFNMNALGLPDIENFIRLSRAGANCQFDLYGVSKLTSTTLNEAYDVTSDGPGEWDDTTNGEPIADLQGVIDLRGYQGGIGIFGSEIMTTLQRHPDFTARFSNFNAGAVSRAEAARLLAELLELSEVHILTKYYNAANAGLNSSLNRVGARVAWVGRKEHLITVKPNFAAGMFRQDHSYSDYNEHPAPVCVFGHMFWGDVVRAYKPSGTIFTNLYTS